MSSEPIIPPVTPYSNEDPQYNPSLDIRLLRRSLRTIMKPASCLESDRCIQDAVDLMQNKRSGCVLLTTGSRLSGIFTERDVLKKIVGSSLDLRATAVSKVMTPNPQALHEFDTIAYALNFMDLGGYRHVPIINTDLEPVGIVSVKNIISFFVDYFADEVVHLPPHPFTNPEGNPFKDFE